MKAAVAAVWKKALASAPSPERAAHYVKELALKTVSTVAMWATDTGDQLKLSPDRHGTDAFFAAAFERRAG